MARLLHILHAPPASGLPALLEEQLGAGHRVEVVLLPGAEEGGLPEGCALHRLDPVSRPPDADALLDLLYACDAALTW